MIDLSARARYRVSERTAPPRIVIDFTAVTPRLSGDDADLTHEVGTAAVGRVRVNRMRRGAQIVVDLAKRARYEVLFMPATRSPARPPRVVIDVVEPAGSGGRKPVAPVAPGAVASTVLEPAAPRVGPEGRPVAPEDPGIGAEAVRDEIDANGTAGEDEARAVREEAAREVRAERAGAGVALPVVVLIDPGHGGDDTGARGPRGTHEKDVNLRVARALARRLATYPGITARLTRSGDETLSLSRRQDLAGEHGADLLVSIHSNASPNPKSRGVEIFYLSIDAARKESALARCARASASDLERVLADLSIEESMMLSARLAGAVRGGIDAGAPVKTRKVMQAGFQVLKLGPIPAILVEVGFLTNADEARMLTAEGFAGRMAPAIAGAVHRFAREGLLARPSEAHRQLARAGNP